MRLTRTERWILANQYLILEHLDPETADHYREKRQALEDGYEAEYAPDHIDEDTMTEAQCQEVIDILDMFRALKITYDSMPDKTGIEPWAVKFAGFDGNNEPKYMAYARYFCCKSEGGRFTELDRGDNFNSHMPMLGRYRRQLEAWRQSTNVYQLTPDDVRRIAASAQAR